MHSLRTDDPLAVAAVRSVHEGDVPELERLLAGHPGLVGARLVGKEEECRMGRTLLHVVADWPGHFPRGAESVVALVRAGADVDARFVGPHQETPLHWAASSDDVAVLDALLDAGADIDAAGGVIGGGTPLADARAFKQWRVAYRLVERGARVTLHDAATLGLMEHVERRFAEGAVPAGQEELDGAFWGACHGGRREAAEYLLARGAEINWVPGWEELTPLDAARREGADELVAWLRARGGS